MNVFTVLTPTRAPQLRIWADLGGLYIIVHRMFGWSSTERSNTLQELHESATQDEFFDALASIRSSVSSFVTTTAASLRSPDTGESNLLSSARSGASEVPPVSGRSGSVTAAASVPYPGSNQAAELQRCSLKAHKRIRMSVWACS